MNPTAESFRQPMPVTDIHFFRGLGSYPVCPRCKLTLDREYQRFCDRCGQRLDWLHYGEALPKP